MKVLNHPLSRSNQKVKQAGFTLIELMVVLVIVAVVMGVTVLSLSSNEKSRLNAQKNQLKSYLSLVRDQSTFDLKLYLVAPDQQGLKTLVFDKDSWKIASKVAPLVWQDGVMADWRLDSTFAHRQQLPSAGWIFWPSGEVLSGKVTFTLQGGAQSQAQAESELDNSVAWNNLLKYKTVP